MLCAEWWAFEILILLSGIIGVKEQAALIIQFTICSMTYMVNLGIQEASATLIGNQIGALNVQEAKSFAKTIFMLALGIGVVVSSLLLIYKHEISWLFTTNPEIESLTVKIFPLLFVANIIDSMQMCQQGCVRALGL